MKEVCSKHLAQLQFALQLQQPRLVGRPVPVQAGQQVQVVQQLRVVRLVQVVQQVRVVRLVRAQAEQPVQAQQPHSPHQQLQSQCQPELCRLH